MFYRFIGLIIGFATVAAHADTITTSQMRSAITSNICPANPTFVDRPSQSERCGGDGTSNPCGTGGNVNKVCSEKYRVCVKDWIDESGQINEYNAWIASCKSNTKRSSPSPTQPGRSSQSDNLEDRLKAQTKKTEEAPAKNQANKRQMEFLESKTLEMRDRELEAARKDVAERQKRDAENRASEKAKADAARASEPPPIIPQVSKLDKYSKFSSVMPRFSNQLKERFLQNSTCAVNEDGYMCKWWGPGFTDFTNRCYDIREYNMEYQGSTPRFKGRRVDVLCMVSSD